MKRYILEFQERNLGDVKPREMTVKSVKGKATVITGPRRTGKAYYLFNVMKAGPREDYLYCFRRSPIRMGRSLSSRALQERPRPSILNKLLSLG